MEPRWNRARITSLDEIAPSVFELRATMLEPSWLIHEPGQSISIRIADTSEQRSYSLASRPGQHDELVLLVRRIGGIGSQFLSSLKVGATMEFEGPRGEFRLADGAGDSVFGATGVGVSALIPMMEALLDRPGDGRVWFYWGLTNREDRFWDERLGALARSPRFKSHLVYTGAGDGFITEPIIETARDLVAPIYYLCGNGQMVRDVIGGLSARGVDRERQIRTDWY
ncbi:MAG TPA: FAD-binding oxidoreductase [Kofleriaceae bacterium]|nr:FAD-binding oxidoreductase [Kofleriaceae bacterium]